MKWVSPHIQDMGKKGVYLSVSGEKCVGKEGFQKQGVGSRTH